MDTADDPTSEKQLVDMLLARNGSRTRITTVNNEPMKVMRVEVTDLPSAYEWDHYAEIGGIGLSADGGKYSFYSTEIGRIEDVASGAIIYARERS